MSSQAAIQKLLKSKLINYSVKYRHIESVGKSITFNFLYLSHVGIRLFYWSMLSLSQATVLYKKKERKGSCVIAQHKVLLFKYIPHSDDGSGWGCVGGKNLFMYR